MKRFLIRVLLSVAIPVLCLAGIYVVTDPYKTLKPFSLTYFNSTNRDYLSTELFLKNYPGQKYDSYIFSSSKGCGLNTYHWKKYLPEGASQFLFQAWGETVTGIEQKIDYIDTHGYDIDNVILLLDFPSTFAEKQNPTEAMSIKHPEFSGRSRLLHQMILFYDFCQKPSQWIIACRTHFKHKSPAVTFDPVSNDWEKGNALADLSVPPAKDSLKNCSLKSKRVFLHDYYGSHEGLPERYGPMVDPDFQKQFLHIKDIFDRHHTAYKVIISPVIYGTAPSASEEDIKVLKKIFGNGNVFHYSGKNYLTEDYNNFSDPNHFGLWAGWHIIEDIFNKPE